MTSTLAANRGFTPPPFFHPAPFVSIETHRLYDILKPYSSLLGCTDYLLSESALLALRQVSVCSYCPGEHNEQDFVPPLIGLVKSPLQGSLDWKM
jgi:hypothetical protein